MAARNKQRTHESLTTAKTYTDADLSRLSAEFEGASPQDVLCWAIDEFFPDLTLACSFGGPSGMVLVDMIRQIEPRTEVFYVDTDFLFPETYATRDRVMERYGVNAVGYKSLLTPEEQAAKYGDQLWLTNPDLCCGVRKVEPNRRALKGKRAWISGLRRDQSAARRDTPILQWVNQLEIIKVNPLVNWTEGDVWAYVLKHDVPYNPLHDQSYPSVGCTYCTKPVKDGDDLRSGRWQGLDKTECGIHLDGPVPLARGEELIG
jgi:phosphoadenosine phosphosulfate reductase